MLTIRLSRVGKKNKPMYRLIISEKARDPYGRSLEILGSYNPYTKELQAKADRIKYWLSKGSGMSATINNLLIKEGIIEGKKIKASKMKKKPARNATHSDAGGEKTSKGVSAPKEAEDTKDAPKDDNAPTNAKDNEKKTEENTKVKETPEDPKPAEQPAQEEKSEPKPKKEDKKE